MIFCQIPLSRYQKQATFTLKQFQFEIAGFENKMAKVFKGTKKGWPPFHEPAFKKPNPNIQMIVAARTENGLENGKATCSVLKSVPGGEILSLTDMHGQSLRLKALEIEFKKSSLSKRVKQMKIWRIVLSVNFYNWLRTSTKIKKDRWFFPM